MKIFSFIYSSFFLRELKNDFEISVKKCCIPVWGSEKVSSLIENLSSKIMESNEPNIRCHTQLEPLRKYNIQIDHLLPTHFVIYNKYKAISLWFVWFDQLYSKYWKLFHFTQWPVCIAILIYCPGRKYLFSIKCFECKPIIVQFSLRFLLYVYNI